MFICNPILTANLRGFRLSIISCTVLKVIRQQSTDRSLLISSFSVTLTNFTEVAAEFIKNVLITRPVVKSTCRFLVSRTKSFTPWFPETLEVLLHKCSTFVEILVNVGGHLIMVIYAVSKCCLYQYIPALTPPVYTTTSISQFPPTLTLGSTVGSSRL